jgi:hypothetical protein
VALGWPLTLYFQLVLKNEGVTQALEEELAGDGDPPPQNGVSVYGVGERFKNVKTAQTRKKIFASK